MSNKILTSTLSALTLFITGAGTTIASDAKVIDQNRNNLIESTTIDFTAPSLKEGANKFAESRVCDGTDWTDIDVVEDNIHIHCRPDSISTSGTTFDI